MDSTHGSPVLITGMAVLAAAILAAVLTRFDRGRSAAWLRLDWFLPMLRRSPDDPHPAHSLLGRFVKHWLPTRWQSNWRTKQPGPLRRFLRRLGRTWQASPLRRFTQLVCLAAFLALFLLACWPYGARPAPAPQAVPGWRLAGIDQESGEFHLMQDSREPAAGWLIATAVVAVGPEVPSLGSAAGSALWGDFLVRQAAENELRLRPAEPLTAELLDLLLTSDRPLVVYDRRPDAWPSHYADHLARREWVSAELFLLMDPLVSLSTAIASRSWIGSLGAAAAILLVCLLIPRGFCGYVCPLGTTIDLFDWAVAGRTPRFRVSADGWWVHLKYYLLVGILVAAGCGVLISGFFAAIPVITRAALFALDPLQTGAALGWHQVPEFGGGQMISLLLFLAILGLGFLRPRFWCKYVCPSGAVFSLGNLLRITERKVEASCIHCNKCVEICPFDAIKPDFTTRTTDCTLCQSCAGVCPMHSIKFVERWNLVQLKAADDPPTGETALGRRGFLSLAAGSALATVGGVAAARAVLASDPGQAAAGPDLPVRPPGSVPEPEFLEMCIRCGECFKVCPNHVLQPEGFQQGLAGLWTPLVKADWAGCESSCNACGQVCPTGAIRALPLEEKRAARMGLALVNLDTCLPHAQRGDCDLCVQECVAAGYDAIEYTLVGAQTDNQGQPVEGTGFLAPVVDPDRCVGCGLCQTRCFAINVKNEGVLEASAIVIEAGQGREDRLLSGSYLEQRARREAAQRGAVGATGDDRTDSPIGPAADTDNPFGL